MCRFFFAISFAQHRIWVLQRAPLVLLACVLGAPQLFSNTITIDFEGFADGTALTTQYPGVTFANATIATAGISLNEFEFPPHSGENVVFDDGGPITIDFAKPALSFAGYFTYSVPLTLGAFNTANNLVASATSAFSNNEALSGDPGSSPNEFLQVSFEGGISDVTIIGAPAGGSFVLDDATIATTTSTVPEPGSLVLLLIGVGIFTCWEVRLKTLYQGTR